MPVQKFRGVPAHLLVSGVLAILGVLVFLTSGLPAAAAPGRPLAISPTATPPMPTAVPTDDPAASPSPSPSPDPSPTPSPSPTPDPTLLPTPVPPRRDPPSDKDHDPPTPVPAPTATPQPPAPTPVPPVADVTIVKQADRATVKPGETVRYTLVVRNVGSGVARDVVVTDTVPDALEVIDLHSTTGEIVVSGQIVTAYPSVLEVGETVTITITARARSQAAAGTVTNVALVTSSSEGDGGDGNNRSSVSTEILPPALAQVPPQRPSKPTPQPTPSATRPQPQEPRPVLPATGDPTVAPTGVAQLLPWVLLAVVAVACAGLWVWRRRASDPLRAIAPPAAGLPLTIEAPAPTMVASRSERASEPAPDLGPPLPAPAAPGALPPPADLDRDSALTA